MTIYFKAAAVALAAGLPFASTLPADAATKTITQCGVKTAWKLAGEDDNSDVRVKVWTKKSTTPGKVAVCVKAYDLHNNPANVLLTVTYDDGKGNAAAGGSSLKPSQPWVLVRVPTGTAWVMGEARLATKPYPTAFVWTKP